MILSQKKQDKVLLQIKSLMRTKQFIQQEEGVRTETYTDHKGIKTIGVGFNLQRTDASTVLLAVCGIHFDKDKKTMLSAEQIEKLFHYCLAEATLYIIKKISLSVFQSLLAHQQQALISLVYNSKVLLGEHLMENLQQQNWEAVAAEIRWNSNKSHDLHLVPRREREAVLFMGE